MSLSRQDVRTIEQLLARADKLIALSGSIKDRAAGPSRRIVMLSARSDLLIVERMLAAKAAEMEPGRFSTLRRAINAVRDEMAAGTRIKPETVRRLVASLKSLLATLEKPAERE